MSVNALPSDHAAHDELLVATLAADDLTGAELEGARRLVESCPACALLHDDIRALSAATAALPPPRRPRDFRLAEDDADRLRRRGLRGLLAGLSGPRFAFVQPLGGTLAALGLAGLLVAAVPSILPRSGMVLSSVGTSITAPEAADRAGAGAPGSEGPAAAAGPAASGGLASENAPVLAAPSASAAASAAVPAEPVPPGSAAPSFAANAAPGPSDAKAPPGREPAIRPSAGEPASALGGPSAGPDPAALLAAGSVALLVAGLGLFLLGRAARRSSAS